MYHDTIAAIATPPGLGALGVVRVSGPDALQIARHVFIGRLAPRRVAFGRLTDPSDGTVVDDVMAVFLPGPRSYTGQDTVEISCHGGPMPVQQTLELLLRQGARAAEPGEFTLRAYLSGRVDLAQAEAVMDVVTARSTKALRTALSALHGELSAEVKAVRDRLMDVLAYLTASADFPDEGIAGEQVEAPLTAALRSLQSLHATAREGQAVRDGVRTAIIGLPNAGKSSLLNRLLGWDRAIVSPQPGTTRDTLSETVVMEGVPFLLTDTAGMGRSSDPVEQVGVLRAQQEADAASLLLLVVDHSEAPSPEACSLAQALPAIPTLLVLNKADLPAAASREAWQSALGREFSGVTCTSTVTGAGLADLRAAMAGAVGTSHTGWEAGLLVANPRHAAALAEAHQAVAAVLSGLRSGTPPDLTAIDLTAAVSALGTITGETASADLLDRIFSRFCIGK